MKTSSARKTSDGAAASSIFPRLAFWKTRKGSIYAAAFLLGLPALIGLVLFYYLPIYQAVRFGFYDYNLIANTLKWKGMGNYTRAFEDKTLLNSFRVTFLYFFYYVPFLMAAGLGLALLVQKTWRGVGLFRTIILLPTVTSMVVVTTIWGFMYHPTSGLFNSLLTTIGLPAQDFLIGKESALPSIAAITIWKDAGLTMLFYLAGLMGIPREYYEAAMIDGANAWQRFRHITLPLLKGTTLFVLITSTVSAFKVFVPVFMTTRGGPSNATKVIVLSIYDYAFKFNQMGYAAAVSVLVALILVVLSVTQFLVTREKAASRRAAYGPKKVPFI